MKTIKYLLKKIRSKWHLSLSTVQRYNRTSLISVYAFCQNEFMRRQNVRFKNLPVYGYYEKIHQLLTIYEIPMGGVPSPEWGESTTAAM